MVERIMVKDLATMVVIKKEQTKVHQVINKVLRAAVANVVLSR
jgi:hypothetical protein